ncbi:hypothetical protein DFH09DRAFT_1328309 [Mycena vulgaris]|nr:hypothetical protein DFH09DRAFT_1328309 [Mycena vulgaris]
MPADDASCPPRLSCPWSICSILGASPSQLAAWPLCTTSLSRPLCLTPPATTSPSRALSSSSNLLLPFAGCCAGAASAFPRPVDSALTAKALTPDQATASARCVQQPRRKGVQPHTGCSVHNFHAARVPRFEPGRALDQHAAHSDTPAHSRSWRMCGERDGAASRIARSFHDGSRRFPSQESHSRRARASAASITRVPSASRVCRVRVGLSGASRAAGCTPRRYRSPRAIPSESACGCAELRSGTRVLALAFQAPLACGGMVDTTRFLRGGARGGMLRGVEARAGAGWGYDRGGGGVFIPGGYGTRGTGREWQDGGTQARGVALSRQGVVHIDIAGASVPVSVQPPSREVPAHAPSLTWILTPSCARAPLHTAGPSRPITGVPLVLRRRERSSHCSHVLMLTRLSQCAEGCRSELRMSLRGCKESDKGALAMLFG